MKAKQFTNQETGGGYMPQIPKEEKRSMGLLICIGAALIILIAYLIFK